jgi:hypothetical protein
MFATVPIYSVGVVSVSSLLDNSFQRAPIWPEKARTLRRPFGHSVAQSIKGIFPGAGVHLMRAVVRFRVVIE